MIQKNLALTLMANKIRLFGKNNDGVKTLSIWWIFEPLVTIDKVKTSGVIFFLRRKMED